MENSKEVKKVITDKEIELLKTEFRDIFWAYHFRRNIKLSNEYCIKRLRELQKIFEKENITVV